MEQDRTHFHPEDSGTGVSKMVSKVPDKGLGVYKENVGKGRWAARVRSDRSIICLGVTCGGTRLPGTAHCSRG